jgi:hypothetical protein
MDERTDMKQEEREVILKGWEHTSKEYKFGGLTETESAQFERAQFAEQQAERTSFVLGEPLKRHL